MANPANPNGRGSRKFSPSRHAKAHGPNKALTRLRAEKKELLACLRAVEQERDAYRRAIYAWVEEQLAKEDLPRLAASKEGLPLNEFFHQLESSNGK